MDLSSYDGPDTHLTPTDYQFALYAQSAVNSYALITNLNSVMRRIADEPRCTGTDWRNHHPILILYLAQLAHLADAAPLSFPGEPDYSDAYDYCTTRSRE